MSFLFISLPWLSKLSNELLWSINKLKQGLWCTICLTIFSSFFSELFLGEVSETLVILSAILFPMKLPVVSAVLQIEAVLSPSVADCLARSKSFWQYLPLKCLIVFCQHF